MNSNTKQMKTIHLFFTMVLLGITTIQLQAQTTDWVGEWNTKFTYTDANWKLDITKDSHGEYIGVFPDGKLVGKITNGELTGTYTRTPNSFDRTGMGKMGVFRFVPAADNENMFTGYYKVEGKDIWQPDTWTGKKKLPLTFVQQIEKREREEKYKKLNKDVLPKGWTGTWTTDNMGTLKVLVSDKDNVEAKYSYNNKKNYGDIKGSLGKVNAYNDVKWFTGTVTNEKKITGRMEFYIYEKDKFRGYIMWNDGPKDLLGLDTHGTTTNVTGRRLSTAKPDMRSYP